MHKRRVEQDNREKEREKEGKENEHPANERRTRKSKRRLEFLPRRKIESYRVVASNKFIFLVILISAYLFPLNPLCDTNREKVSPLFMAEGDGESNSIS